MAATGWVRRARLPIPTVASFAVFALLFWLNAAVNRYRFNVVLAGLTTVPLIYLLLRGLVKARTPVAEPKAH